MAYQNADIARASEELRKKFDQLPEKGAIRRAPELQALFGQIKNLPANERAAFGKEINDLKNEIESWIKNSQQQAEQLAPIDVTAPLDVNTPPDKRPRFLPALQGSVHPLTKELEAVLDIFNRMGFTAVESRQLDDDYHMFESLNFPAGHPARDHYDTFVTDEDLIAPAHTSTMQNRMLRLYASNLEKGQPIAVVIPGRVFRNEDVDARHDHTFYQFEGIYVDKGINTGNLIATLKTFLETYYEQQLEVRIQPFYFPFTEPSLEFAMSCPFCQKAGCQICSHTGWIELLGCGLVHPNVLRMADIDPAEYTGFAWGCGLERLVMMKNNIEDIRHFESGNLKFLTQFRGIS